LPSVAPTADFGAQTHGGHRLRLGENLGIGTDAHLQILGPGALPDQRFLHLRGLGRAGTNLRQVVADHRDDFPAHGDRLGRIATRLFLDDALERAGDERDAGGLQCLQIARRQEPR
jgi:hypothetical protein